jgi:hypothetical protein
MYIEMFLIVLVCICIQLYKKVYVRDKIIEIPKKEIYSQNMEENIFMEVIIRTEEVYKEYAERYNIVFEGKKVDFSQNSILLVSKHEVKALSYNEKNRQNYIKNLDILDVIYYKEETRKLYIYEIPHLLITWDETRSIKPIVFEE